MAETTRAFAVLAALVLALAPVTNGVLERAAQTAERVILEPADWNREPPENPPNATPPEDPPDTNRSFNGSAGPSPSCQVATEPVAAWNHTPPGADPPASTQNRTLDGTTQDFEVNDTLIGLGVTLRIRNLTGELSASVAPQGDSGEAPFSYDREVLSSQQGENVFRNSTIPRSQLVNGTWVAELNHRQANYDRLVFGVVRASCAGASG